jgi:RHS repeat-associated protein
MMSSLKCPLYKSLYSTITFKKVMVLVCSVLLLTNSFGVVLAGNPFFNQTIGAATTPSGANQPLINQQLYGFDGQLTDPESGYQFLGRGYHRAYNPVTRRFMSQDSMSPFSKGGFNGYIFAHNNPIMHQDPSGHMSTNFWINIGAILGAIVGAVFAPFTGGSTAVIAAGEVAAAAGATSGALGAAGAATHNKALQKASLGLGIAGAAIDAVNIIGSGAKLVASSADAGVTAASDGSKISTTVGGGASQIADTSEASEAEQLLSGDHAISKDFLVSYGEPIGIGCEGIVYEYNGSAYKIYNNARISEEETQAERDARVLNQIHINNEAGFKANAVGSHSEILRSPLAEEFNGNYEFLSNLDKRIQEENSRLMLDLHEGNFGIYNNRPVVLDVGATLSLEKDFGGSVNANNILNIYTTAIPRRSDLYHQIKLW